MRAIVCGRGLAFAIALVAAIVMVMTLPMRAAADQAGEAGEAAGEGNGSEADPLPLVEQRWEELTFGVSLRPWVGARIAEPPPPGTLVHLVGEGFELRASIREVGEREHVPVPQRRAPQREPDPDEHRAMDMEAFLDWAPQMLYMTYPDTQLLSQRLKRIGERPGAQLVYRIGSLRAEDWILGQAFMALDPFTVVRFELSAALDQRHEALATFDAVLESVQVAHPRELDEQRTTWIEAGRDWLAQVDRAQREAHLVDEQWFRVMRNGRDIGHRRVTQERATELGRPVIRIEVAERVHADAGVFDTVSEYFESLDASTEFWSIVTARRHAPQRDQRGQVRWPGQQQQQSPTRAAAETGLRSRQSLSVSHEGEDRVRNEEWPELPENYLSQVDLQLLHAIMPRDQRTMAFYAYHGNSGRVTLRIVTVMPLDDGGLRIHQRPAPNRGEEVATYDAQGRLVERRLADGRVLVPTDERTLREIWDGR